MGVELLKRNDEVNALGIIGNLTFDQLARGEIKL